MNIAESFSTALQAGNMAQQQADMQAANKIKLLQGMMTSLAQGMEGTGAMAQGVAGAATRLAEGTRQQDIYEEQTDLRRARNAADQKSAENQLSFQNAIANQDLDGKSIAELEALGRLHQLSLGIETSKADKDVVARLKEAEAALMESKVKVAALEGDRAERINIVENQEIEIEGKKYNNQADFLQQTNNLDVVTKHKLLEKNINLVGGQVDLLAEQARIAEQKLIQERSKASNSPQAESARAALETIRAQMMAGEYHKAKLEINLTQSMLKDSNGEWLKGSELLDAIPNVTRIVAGLSGRFEGVAENLGQAMSQVRSSQNRYEEVKSEYEKDGEIDSAEQSELNRLQNNINAALDGIMQVTGAINQEAATRTGLARFHKYLKAQGLDVGPLEKFLIDWQGMFNEGGNSNSPYYDGWSLRPKSVYDDKNKGKRATTGVPADDQFLLGRGYVEETEGQVYKVFSVMQETGTFDKNKSEFINKSQNSMVFPDYMATYFSSLARRLGSNDKPLKESLGTLVDGLSDDLPVLITGQRNHADLVRSLLLEFTREDKGKFLNENLNAIIDEKLKEIRGQKGGANYTIDKAKAELSEDGRLMTSDRNDRANYRKVLNLNAIKEATYNGMLLNAVDGGIKDFLYGDRGVKDPEGPKKVIESLRQRHWNVIPDSDPSDVNIPKEEGSNQRNKNTSTTGSQGTRLQKAMNLLKSLEGEMNDPDSGLYIPKTRGSAPSQDAVGRPDPSFEELNVKMPGQAAFISMRKQAEAILEAKPKEEDRTAAEKSLIKEFRVMLKARINAMDKPQKKRGN
ncbi:hypothetical protein CMK19_00875 [Candidatus Poribacteria bacterium]|nr:hypothetical protein [Candidatus Poribacteria bacterium]